MRLIKRSETAKGANKQINTHTIMYTIIEKKEVYKLKEGTKTAYKLVELETNELTKEQYNRTVSTETQKEFRRFGGSETAQKDYTCFGYLITKLISKSPDKTTKIVRTYKFTKN